MINFKTKHKKNLKLDPELDQLAGKTGMAEAAAS